MSENKEEKKKTTESPPAEPTTPTTPSTPSTPKKKKKVMKKKKKIVVRKKKKKGESGENEMKSADWAEKFHEVNPEETQESLKSLIANMKGEQGPLMKETIKGINEQLLGFMKGVLTSVTKEMESFSVVEKMSELKIIEERLKKKEKLLNEREKSLEKREKELSEKEERIVQTQLKPEAKKKDVKLAGLGRVSEEYMLIDSQFANVDKGHFSIAQDPKNILKNRYSNILPYNHTLVKLPSKRYINANYIDLHGLKFIGTQWPLDNDIVNTEEEFWEMIYEEDAHVIVALQKPKPPKHHYYYPTELGESKKYGEIRVTHFRKIDHPFFQVLTLKLQKGGGLLKTTKGIKEVKLCLFLTWPDHGIPKKQHPLFAMIKTARLMNIDVKRSSSERRNFPIVVHCSAGIGRTGVYIALDVCIQNGFGVDRVKNIVEEMRKQRYGMIQTVNQYKYVFDNVALYGSED